MSIPTPPPPGLPVLSILSSEHDAFWPALLDDLAPRFGQPDYDSGLLPFDFTHYYDDELGTPITRRFLAFEELAESGSLVESKLFTNEIERHHQRADGRRLFNLDPGLLWPEKLVLASGKNFSHRIHISKGIYADLTLVYQNNGWLDLPWTFPDYASATLKEHLTAMRSLCLRALKHHRGSKRA